jgi:hypothetical protein
MHNKAALFLPPLIVKSDSKKCHHICDGVTHMQLSDSETTA